jgi:DNA repair protein RadC
MNQLENGIRDAEDRVITQALQILKERFIKNPIEISSPGALRNYLKLKTGSLQHEVFGCLFLTVRNSLIEDTVLFRGTLSHCSVYPREVLKQALQCNAASVIFYHNHPSGNCAPSEADKEMTKNLNKALSLIDVPVRDHIIVAGFEDFSFAENALI